MRHTEDDEWPPSSFSFSLDEKTASEGGLRFTVDFLDRLGGGDLPEYYSIVQPAVADLRLRNDGDEPKILTFHGFVPFSDPRGPSEESDDALFVLPRDEDELQRFEINGNAPPYERVRDYWTLTEPFDPPSSSTTVTLAPGAELGGEHVFVSKYEDIRENGSGNPYPSRYPFESSVTVESPSGEQSKLKLAFVVRVHVSE